MASFVRQGCVSVWKGFLPVFKSKLIYGTSP
jgi:hypothetical protein